MHTTSAAAELKAAPFVGRGGVLDALRFLTACWIVVYHYGNEAPVTLDRLSPMFLHGYLATDFFLMLSGYVMARVYGDALLAGRIKPSTFLFRRIQRIWPAHLIVLAVLVAVVGVATAAGFPPGHPERFLWRDVVPQALLIQAWAHLGGAGWNLPTWSLSALLVCYAVTPAAFRIVRRIGSAPVVLAGAVFFLAMCDLGCRYAWRTSLYELHVELGVIRALPLFILGLAAARCAAERPLAARPARIVAIAATVGFLALQTIGRFDFFSMILIGLLLLAVGSRSVTRPLPALEAAARLSFSLFLTHSLTVTVYFGVMHHLGSGLSEPWRWAIWAMSLPTALGVAYGFDRWVDAPLQQWMRSQSVRAPVLASA